MHDLEDPGLEREPPEGALGLERRVGAQQRDEVRLLGPCRGVAEHGSGRSELGTSFVSCPIGRFEEVGAGGGADEGIDRGERYAVTEEIVDDSARFP